MCGFIGIYDINAFKSESYVRNKLKAISENIKFRGPDDYGCWLDLENGVGIAHRRLSIQDLSQYGHQPMHSYTERYVIAFNGEIYNHLSLRKELEKINSTGIAWRGSSDTETLLELFEYFGISKTLHKLKGMFSIALWDRFEKCIYLIRDRFGEKPLYFGFGDFYENSNEKTFIFGSDLNPLKNSSKNNFALNEMAIFEYFKYGYISPPLSIFKDINQLSPGHLIKIKFCDKNKYEKKIIPSQSEWYSPQKKSLLVSKIQDPHNELEDIEALDKKLSASVKEQTISDVPIGTFLSGGIDSSLITSLLQFQSKIPINTFTIAFHDSNNNSVENFNEAPYAKKISQYLGTNHSEISLSPIDVKNIVPQIANIYSEPFSDSSQIPTALICKFAKMAGITVALTGDGSDELFGGYNRHFLAPKIYKYFSSVPNLFKQLLTQNLRFLPISSSANKEIAMQKLTKAILNSKNINLIYDALLSNSLFKPQEILNPILDFDMDINKLPKAKSLNEKIMLADAQGYLNADILTKVDRASMWNSLETRAPFLDHEIAEFAWSLPITSKIRNNGIKWESKWILRQILYKYIPKKLLDRPKAGFALPIGEWLRGPLRDWAEDLISTSVNPNYNYINSKFIRNIWMEHLSRKNDHSQLLWSILIWKSWLNEWNYC